MSERRIAYPTYGNDQAMGYKFRARIENKPRRKWFGFGRIIGTKYRYVIEKHFMSWEDDQVSLWYKNEDDAIQGANKFLDSIEEKPKGKYVKKEI